MCLLWLQTVSCLSDAHAAHWHLLQIDRQNADSTDKFGPLQVYKLDNRNSTILHLITSCIIEIKEYMVIPKEYSSYLYWSIV